MGFLAKLREGLAKTKNAIWGRIDSMLKAFVRVDEDLLEELEELLITADVGVNATEEILDRLREEIKEERLKSPDQVKGALKVILADLIGEAGTLELNTTPSRYLSILRLRHAKQLLLHYPYSITEISEMCGYSNPYYFTNAFRGYTGMSPTDFRKHYLKEK